MEEIHSCFLNTLQSPHHGDMFNKDETVASEVASEPNNYLPGMRRLIYLFIDHESEYMTCLLTYQREREGEKFNEN